MHSKLKQNLHTNRFWWAFSLPASSEPLKNWLPYSLCDAKVKPFALNLHTNLTFYCCNKASSRWNHHIPGTSDWFMLASGMWTSSKMLTQSFKFFCFCWIASKYGPYKHSSLSTVELPHNVVKSAIRWVQTFIFYWCTKGAHHNLLFDENLAKVLQLSSLIFRTFLLVYITHNLKNSSNADMTCTLCILVDEIYSSFRFFPLVYLSNHQESRSQFLSILTAFVWSRNVKTLFASIRSNCFSAKSLFLSWCYFETIKTLIRECKLNVSVRRKSIISIV